MIEICCFKLFRRAREFQDHAPEILKIFYNVKIFNLLSFSQMIFKFFEHLEPTKNSKIFWEVVMVICYLKCKMENTDYFYDEIDNLGL